MQVSIAFQDGFEHDTVVIRVDGEEAYRAEGLTTRTQISHAGGTSLEVPDGGAMLDVEVVTRGVRGSVPVGPGRGPNVAVSLMDGRLEARYPEHLGLA